MTAIPRIDLAALRAHDPQAVAALVGAARDPGFLVLDGLADAAYEADMRLLLRFFALPEAAKRTLARRKFEPGNRNVYRGYFPVQDGDPTYKEGLDMGRDVLPDGWTPPSGAPSAGDPLTEPTPFPDPEPCADWRATAARAYGRSEAAGRDVLAALLGGLGVAPEGPLGWFQEGNSTLRLLRYPRRTPASLPAETEWLPDGRTVVGRPHNDSGFLTLLWTDGSGGLQVRTTDGGWLEMPGDGIAVNFGRMLSDISGGAIRATEHRVVGGLGERCSVPFFLEPRVDARVEPLRGAGDSYLYGDFLWAHMQNFLEFRGVERRPA